MGGDTAYHASDYMTLVNRIQHPFAYAFLDLVKNGLIAADEPRRPIFGIPGNHDYYDQVDGFRRQFRKPVRPEGPLPPGRSGPTNAQLTHRRIQTRAGIKLRFATPAVRLVALGTRYRAGRDRSSSATIPALVRAR